MKTLFELAFTDDKGDILWRSKHRTLKESREEANKYKGLGYKADVYKFKFEDENDYSAYGHEDYFLIFDER